MATVTHQTTTQVHSAPTRVVSQTTTVRTTSSHPIAEPRPPVKPRHYIEAANKSFGSSSASSIIIIVVIIVIIGAYSAYYCSPCIASSASTGSITGESGKLTKSSGSGDFTKSSNITGSFKKL